MRSTAFYCAALFLLASLTPLLAADKPKDLIIGKWEMNKDKQKITVEFAKDGVLKLHLNIDEKNIDLDGKYKFIDDDNIEVELTFMGETKKEKMKIAVTKDELMTTDSMSKKETFNRTK